MTGIDQAEIDRMGSEFSHAAVVHHMKWITPSVVLESTLFLIAQGAVSDPQATAESALRRLYARALEACDCALGQRDRRTS